MNVTSAKKTGLTHLPKERRVKDGIGTMGEGGLGKRGRREVSPEMKIPESIAAAPEKSDKGNHIHVASKEVDKGRSCTVLPLVGVDEKKLLVEESKKSRCKGTDSYQEAPTVNIFSRFYADMFF